MNYPINEFIRDFLQVNDITKDKFLKKLNQHFNRKTFGKFLYENESTLNLFNINRDIPTKKRELLKDLDLSMTYHWNKKYINFYTEIGSDINQIHYMEIYYL